MKSMKAVCERRAVKSGVLGLAPRRRLRRRELVSANAMAQILTPETLDAYVLRATLAAEAIDVHTHILPPTHGALMLYGIDELLTYHYLCLLYTSPSPRDGLLSRMPSSA